MASWSRNKVDSSTINGGNEYERGDRVSRQNLNAMVNAGLYAQDFAEHIADTPDTTDAGNVGTPSVSFVDNIVGGKTYKKFKFENLKGATGATGNGIASVSKTSTSGLTDTYTITFTNGNSTTFTVKNGDSVDMRVDSGYFQWKRTQDSTWTNLIAVSAIAQVDQSLDISSTNAISNSAVTNKFASTLQLPSSAPTENKIAGINTSNNQTNLSLYLHKIVLRASNAIICLETINSSQTQYSISDIKDGITYSLFSVSGWDSTYNGLIVDLNTLVNSYICRVLYFDNGNFRDVNSPVGSSLTKIYERVIPLLQTAHLPTGVESVNL